MEVAQRNPKDRERACRREGEGRRNDDEEYDAGGGEGGEPPATALANAPHHTVRDHALSRVPCMAAFCIPRAHGQLYIAWPVSRG